MRKRYLFFDFDGTLTAGDYGHTYIPESTRLALKKLEQAGHFTAIATGRAQAMARDYMRELGIRNMVSDGGNGLTVDGELLGILPLPHAEICALLRECDEKGFPWAVVTDNTKTRFSPDSRLAEADPDPFQDTVTVPGLDPSGIPEIYKAYIICTAEEEQTLEAIRYLPRCRFQPTVLFIEPADKAAGIKRMMALFGADCADVIVFGDEANDLSMFLPEWTCVAMGNAVPELKAAADFVTDDSDRDGIYNACLRLGLFEDVDTHAKE